MGEKETCKLTGFGMARDVQQERIYERKTKVLNHSPSACKVMKKAVQILLYRFPKVNNLVIQLLCYSNLGLSCKLRYQNRS